MIVILEVQTLKKFVLSKRQMYKDAGTVETSYVGAVLLRAREYIEVAPKVGLGYFYAYPKSAITLGLFGIVGFATLIKKIYEDNVSIQSRAEDLKDLVIKLDNIVAKEAAVTNNKELLSKYWHWRDGLRRNTGNLTYLNYIKNEPTSKEFIVGINALMAALKWIDKEWDISLKDRKEFNDLYNSISLGKFLFNKKIKDLESKLGGKLIKT